nr:integrase, catalytic region, zinc finger, CCHC-type, peptidase aspartic, catalytic [Tanacetum cinerariifolium]
CRGKDNGVNILKSIDEGPYKLGTFRESLAESIEGTPQFGPERLRVYSDLNSKERDRGLDNAFDDDVDEQPVQDLALNVDNVFQAEDSDPITDEAGLSYDLDILSEYVKDIDVSVVHSNASSVPNDTFMMICDDMCEPIAPSVSNSSRNAVVKNSLTAELATYREQVELKKH